MATTKSGAKKASRKRKEIAPGDSPINVGGGGGVVEYVELEFDHNVYYLDDSDYPDDWISEDRQPDYVEIKNSVGTIVDTYIGVNKVVVGYTRGAGALRRMTFKDSPIKLKFKGFRGKDLPYHGRKHHGDGLLLRNVSINDGNPIPLGEDWQVIVHTKYV